MIYLICFALSALCAYMAGKQKTRWKFWLFSALSILLPVLLAGLRDMSIGIDVKNYYNMERFWRGAIKAESLGKYMEYYISKGYKEPLFALFIGIIAQVTGQFRVFLFLSHLVIMTGVYIGCYRMRDRVRPELLLLLFLLLYFNNSLNIIRQYMAVAIVFSVFADLEQRKFIRYMVVVLVASLIHTTALLSLAPLAIYLLLYPKKELNRTDTWRFVVAVCAVIVGTLCFIPAVKQFMKWGILPKKYAFFFKDATGKMALTRAGLLVLEMAGIGLLFKKLTRKIPHIAYYLVHTVIFMCFQFLAPSITYGHRLVVHFALVNNVMLLRLPQMLRTKRQRQIGYIIVFAFVLYFWHYLYVRAQSSETFPYLFCF